MFVYAIVNLVNLKLYIGKTKNKDLQRYWRSQKRIIFGESKSETSKPYLFNAVRKYGWENFAIFPLLSECKTDEELLYWEKVLIKALGTQRDGYNICAGGRGTIGWKPSPETRAKQSASNLGKKHKPMSAESQERRLKALHASVEERLASGNYHGEEGLEKIRNARAEQNEEFRIQKLKEYEQLHPERRQRAANTHRGMKHKSFTYSPEGRIRQDHGRHIRWHVNRGKIRSNCDFCSSKKS